jgi:hypothetical protein
MPPIRNKGRPFGIGTRKGGFDAVSVGLGAYDYNEKIPIETSQKNHGRDFWIRNLGGVANKRGPFFFTIDQLPDEYLQMNRTRLELTLKVTREDGSKLESFADMVAPVNLLGAVFWENVEVWLNDQPFSTAAAANAGLKAYIDSLLSYDFDARHTHLHTQLMQPDSPGNEATTTLPLSLLRQNLIEWLTEKAKARPRNAVGDAAVAWIPAVLALNAAQKTTLDTLFARAEPPEDETNPQRIAREERWLAEETAANDVLDAVLRNRFNAKRYEEKYVNRNIGWEERAQLCAFSSTFELYAPIPHDFFNMSKVIGPGNKIDIKLERYSDAFLLNASTTGYKIELIDMKLHLHAFRRLDSIAVPTVEKYRMNETVMYKHVVAKGMPRDSFRIVHGGILPKTVVVAMNFTKAIEGDYTENPFNFSNMDLRRIALNINGEEFPAAGGLKFDFSKPVPDVARGYHWLYDNTGAWFSQRGNCITYSAFKNGSFILPFDLTPDRCNGMHEHDGVYGTIDLVLEFGTPLEEPVTVCYELTFPKVVINNKNRGTLHILDVTHKNNAPSQ